MVGVQRLDQRAAFDVIDLLGQRAAQGDDFAGQAFRDVDVFFGAQGKRQQFIIQLHALDDVEHDAAELVRIGGAGQPDVDPVGVDVLG